MPNTLYRYSAGLGMQEKLFSDDQSYSENFWRETPDLAFVSYYLYEWSLFNESIRKLEHALSENKKELEALHKEYGYLKEKYPEEFI